MIPTTNPGLTAAEVEARTLAGLVNRTRSSARADYAAIASRHLFTLFNLIVLPAAVALFYHNEWQAGVSVTGTALVNTLIGLFQEVRAKSRLDRLAILNEGNLVALGTPESLTREIGGDVILLEARDPQTLAGHIRNKFHVDATVMDNQVRIEIENGHRFVPDVVEAFPGEIQSLSVSKPTLEDVFIHRTGHRFWSEEAELAPETGKKKTKKKPS